MHLAYDPSRITELTQRSRRAVDALDAISSTDPATAEAMAAITRLRSVIVNGFIPSTTAVGVIDPLGVGGGRSAARPDDPWSVVAGWFGKGSPSASTRFARWSDDELFEAMTEQLDWFGALDVAEQPDHPFWSEDLPEIAHEFRRRTALDPGLARRLIDAAGENPMFGLVVAQGGFGDDVLAGVAIATATNGVTAFESGAIRSFALDALLADLDGRIGVAIVVLADPDAFEHLFTWNEHDITTRPLDQVRLESILSDVLDAPFHQARLLDDVHRVIANVVGLADHRHFDTGFPPGLAITIGSGLIPYLPYIVGVLDEGRGVRIKDFDGDRNVSIGTQAEVTDLFGNLLRDPVARNQIIATVTALTLADDGDLYDLGDLDDYIETLLDAAENEQVEEQLQTARERDRWNVPIDVVFQLIDKGLAAGGPKFEGAREQLRWLEKGARWLVDRIDVDDIGLDDVPVAVRVMLSIGLAIVFLTGFRPRTEEEQEQVAAAQASFDEVGRMLIERRDGGLDLDELDGKVRDLEDDIEKIEGADFQVSSDPRLEPDRFVPGADTTLTG